MKGMVNIDLGKPAIDVNLQIVSIEDVDRALTSIQNAARALWPEIVFRGEDGFAEAAGEDDDAAGDDEPVDLPSPKVMRQKVGGGGREDHCRLRRGRAGARIVLRARAGTRGERRGQDRDRRCARRHHQRRRRVAGAAAPRRALG